MEVEAGDVEVVRITVDEIVDEEPLIPKEAGELADVARMLVVTKMIDSVLLAVNMVVEVACKTFGERADMMEEVDTGLEVAAGVEAGSEEDDMAAPIMLNGYDHWKILGSLSQMISMP